PDALASPPGEELLGIGEERGRPASVPEDDRFARAELPAPDQIDEPRHGPPGIDGIEEDAFVAGHELDRLALRLAQHRVTAAEVRVVADDLARRHGRLKTDAGGKARGDSRDRSPQLLAFGLDRDA